MSDELLAVVFSIALSVVMLGGIAWVILADLRCGRYVRRENARRAAEYEEACARNTRLGLPPPFPPMRLVCG